MKRNFRNEFKGAELGDARRSKRMTELGMALSTLPAASFPRALGDGAKLEAAYRFLRNPDVDAGAMLAPHVRESASRCGAHTTVVIAHDTTNFRYSSERDGLGRTNSAAKNGFFSHVALAVSPTEIREPLGVLHVESWARGEQREKKHPKKRREDPDRESLRWDRGVIAVEKVVAPTRAIHVMDREADDYELMSELVMHKRRFVIRNRIDRRLDVDEKLHAHAANSPVVTKRDVPLTARKRASLPVKRRMHPPRHARTATLTIKAIEVSLRRPSGVPTSLPEYLPVHVVVVEEVGTPTNEPAVSWRLYTSETIATPADLERIVDLYRCRWVVEEFFKALKTGCAVEKRQLESYHSLVNTLSIYIPIAWRVLRHRSLAHANGAAPTSVVLSELQ